MLEVDIRNITINEKLFQNREQLDKNHVQKIVSNFDFKILQANPVTLYKYNNTNVILSGHHRLEACKIKGVQMIPATFFQGTLEEAQKFALDSNAGSLSESFYERAKKYRQMLKFISVQDVLTEIKKVHTKDANMILEFSLLPENSIPMQELRQFNAAGCTTDNNILLDCCQWTGAVCKTLKIDNQQINEVYRFAKESYIKVNNGKRLFNKVTFVDYVSGMIDRAGGAFVSFKDRGESEVKKAYDSQVKDLQAQIKDAEKLLNEKRQEIMFASLTPEQITQVLQNYEVRIIVLKKQLAVLNGQKDKILNAEKNQTDIFSMLDEPEVIKPPDIELNNEFSDKKPIINLNLTNMETKIKLVQYSDRAFALFGDTKPVKDKLMELGGRFNRYLKQDGINCPGWIFSNKSKEQVTNFINSL